MDNILDCRFQLTVESNLELLYFCNLRAVICSKNSRKLLN